MSSNLTPRMIKTNMINAEVAKLGLRRQTRVIILDLREIWCALHSWVQNYGNSLSRDEIPTLSVLLITLTQLKLRIHN